MPRHTVRLTLTRLQAESLLQLASEADFDTFQSEDGISAARRCRAGEAAMDRLVGALADECSNDQDRLQAMTCI